MKTYANEAEYDRAHGLDVVPLDLLGQERDNDIAITGQLEAGEGFFRLRRGVGVVMAPIRWLWALRIPLGGVTLLPGREGLGKTTVAYDIAARGTRGDLDGDLRGEPFDVIVIGNEDTAASVSKPRLLAAGADMNRVRRAFEEGSRRGALPRRCRHGHLLSAVRGPYVRVA